MFPTTTRLTGDVFGISALLRLALAAAAAIVVLAVAPAQAGAAFGVSGFSVNPSVKQAGAHPNLAVAFNRSGSNAEDLRDFQIDYAPGQLFNPEAAATKCTGTQFAGDKCPSASFVGDFSVNANIDILVFSIPTTAKGSIYVLEPSGLDHAMLGYVLRPGAYAKSFSKQAVKIRTDSDGGQRTVTTNIPRTQSLTWPRIWGGTNIAITRMSLRFNARANASKTGPYFNLNPTSCDASTTRLSATSYQGIVATSNFSWTPTGCTNVPFSPSMTVAMDNPAGGQYTGGTFTVDIPQLDATIQQSALKSSSALLPAGSGLNFALLGSYERGCLEAELLSDTCPGETMVGEASAVVPFYPPAFTGEVYVMDPIGLEVNGAVVLRGPRGMKSIIRFVNTVQGGGANSRVLSNWDYVPQFPFSRFQMHITEPLMKNPACPAGTHAVDTTFTGYSGRVRTVSPAYSTVCQQPIETTIDSAPPALSNDSIGRFEFSSDSASATFECRIDGGPAATCASPYSTPALTDGEHTFSVAAISGGSGDPTPATHTWTVDATPPPAPAIVAPANGSFTSERTPIVRGSALGGSLVTVYRADVFVLCETTADAAGEFSCVSPELPDGQHQLTARACDQAGNCGDVSASSTLTVDTTAPELSIVSPLADADGDVDLDADRLAISQIEGGGSHSCALSDGRVLCWGRNEMGQLGDGTEINRRAPVEVAGLAGVKEIAGGQAHTCAITSSDGVKCWGWNVWSAIGDGTTGGERLAPTDVVGLSSGVDSIASGDGQTCVVTSGGGAMCWGNAFVGSLGNGQSSSNVPVSVTGLASGVAKVAVGFSSGCALLTNGGVKCWGDNTYGQIGDGTTTDRSTPVDVAGLGGEAIDISVGSNSACALRSTGAVFCWGRNGAFHSVGDGTDVETRPNPTPVSGLDSGIVEINSGFSNSCARTSTGGVKCWGDNGYFGLGDGVGAQSAVPVDVVGLDSGVTSIAVSGNNACALLDGDEVRCWGDNRYGQVGDGTFNRLGSSEVLTPHSVIGLRGVSASTSVEFASSDANPGSAQCWVDSSAPAACASPAATGAMAEGMHTFSVRFTDAAGNASQRSVNFDVHAEHLDLDPPETFISGPSGTIGDNTPTFTMSSNEPGATFNCSWHAWWDMQPVANPFTPSSPLADGEQELNCEAVDPSGNYDRTYASATVVIDTSPPAAPQVTSPAADSSTNDNTPLIAGTGAIGSVVSVRSGADLLCTATVAYTGAWSCSVTTPLPDLYVTVTARAADGAGNVSAATTRSFTVDTVAPAQPAITSPVNGSMTTDTTPTLSGTAEALSTVAVRDGATVVCTAVATATGNFSCTSASRPEGLHSFSATATDAATNQSAASSPVNVTIVHVDPTFPVITSPAAGAITNDNTPTFYGTAEANSTVTVYSGTTAICATTTSATGTWNCTAAPALTDGVKSITAIATTVNGSGPPSAARSLTIDTVAPAAPVITSPASGSLSNDSTPAIAGTAEANSAVTVYRGGSTTICVATATAAGGFTCTSSPLYDGTHIFTAIACDAAGNCSAPSAPVTYFASIEPPPPPTIIQPAAGTITNDNTPLISGTSEPGCLVSVRDGAVTIGIATAGGTGAWSLVAPAMTDGSHSLTASCTDATGGTGPSSTPRTFTIDTVAPPPPVITSPADGEITSDSTPTLVGTAEVGSTVTASVNGAVGCTVTTSGSGAWTCTISVLTNSSYQVCVSARDAAGNISPPTCITIFPPAGPPPPPTITTPTAGSVINDSTVLVAGEADPNSVVDVTVAATTACSTVASASGSWSCILPPMTDGAHTICATVTDAAGGVSSPTCRSFTIDTMAPAPPVITTGPEGGLPIDISHWQLWYDGGVDPNTGLSVEPHPSPKWDFAGSPVVQYECSLGLASEPAVYEPCASPFVAPFESLDDTNPSGNNYRFTVRDAANTGSSDTALFKVGPFNPSWNVTLSTYQAMAHPDMTVTVNNPFGDISTIMASAPDYFWGSLSAISQKCSIASAQAGTCSTSAPDAKIGSIAFTVDVDPNPHNDTVPPHQVTRTFDAYLTPAARPGDAAGIAVSIRVIDDAAHGSLDYGTINYIARLKLRYEGNVVHPDESDPFYGNVSDPMGMDVLFEEIPNSTTAGPGVTTGPAGAADLHVRSIIATVLGEAPWYEAPLLWNPSTCEPEAFFDAVMVSAEGSATSKIQDAQATGCEQLEYEPAVTQFDISDNGATDRINDINIGVSFPEGNSTTKSAIIDMPREFVANAAAVQACSNESITVADPQASCQDGANLGTAAVTSPLLPYPLTGDVIGEDSGGTLPNIYMVFKDPDIGLDMRLRGSAFVTKTGSGSGIAAGDFIRTTLNLASDGSPLDLPSIPLNSLVLNLHQEDAGVTLPDGATSLGPIIKVGTGYACNSTASARFLLSGWSGAGSELVSPPVSFNCGANGQAVTNQIGITSGPANGETVTTDSVTFDMQNNHSTAVRLRTSLDDGSKALGGTPYDEPIELNTIATTAAGATRSVTYSGLQDGKVYKFLVQSNASAAVVDQERRTFKVQLPSGIDAPPVISSPAGGSSTNDNTVAIIGTADPACTVVVYDGAAALGSTSVSAGGDWSFTTNPLADGVHDLTARCNSAGGGQSPPSSVRSITVDTVAPPVPAITSPAAGGPIGDNTPTVSGTAETGVTVSVRADSSSVVCTATATAGVFSCTSTPLVDGSHTLEARACDAAGNCSVWSAAISIVIDQVPPSAPVIDSPAQGSFTNDATPLISGTGEAGGTVDVLSGVTVICTDVVDGAGFWSCTSSPLSDGVKSITARLTDTGGNVSTSPSRSFTIDTTPPAAPVITSPANGAVTNDSTPTLSGTAEANSTAVIYDGAAMIGSTVVNAAGAWSFTPAAPLSEGSHALAVRAIDAAANQGAASFVSLTVDTVAPAAPVITAPADGETGSVTNVAGTAEPSSTVTVNEGPVVICTATTNGAGGWMCAPAAPFSSGNHVICAIATDAAGNVSPGDCVEFGGDPTGEVQITTGPEGGLPIDVGHDSDWYNAGNQDPRWDFQGGGISATYECSLVRSSEADSFSPCTSPFQAPFESLDDSVAAGTDYRFRVRIAGQPGSADTALFTVGQFAPTWNVDLSTYQAMANPDMTLTAENPFGDVRKLVASSPEYFWGSLAAITNKCTIASAQAGTCATTAPGSKVGTIAFTADVNPNPHNDLVPPHQVTRTYDGYLTPALVPGDAAGLAVSIRAIDDPAYGSLDYGTINYIARMKLRYDGDGGAIDYSSVSGPRGMDVILENIPNSTLAAPGVIPGPAGAADLHVRSVSAFVAGDSPSYAAPLLYNSSDCSTTSAFNAQITSGANTESASVQSYQATGCESLPYEPVLTQFDISDNGATDLISDIDIGVTFPAGSSTTRSAIVDLPREFVANVPAVQACLSETVMTEDPQAGCSDTANLGTATATSPLLPYPLTGDVIGEDVGGTLPNLYIVFQDPDIGLDTRIRGSASVLKSGSGSAVASGDFIRTTMNVGSDGGPLDLPSLPLNGLVLNLHQEDPGVMLPDGSTSLGSIIKVGTTYACNNTAAARFMLTAWSGATSNIVTPSLAFDCAANGQTVANGILINSGPANGSTVTTSSASFVLQNNTGTALRLRIGLDNGDNAANGFPSDAGIEPNTTATPTTAAGATRTITFSGLEDGKVYKFLVQNNGTGATFDQERRTFKVDLP